MHLLDTSTVIDFLNGKKATQAVMVVAQKNACISTVTIAELWDSHDIHRTRAIENFIESTEVLPLSISAAQHAARIASSLAKEGKRIPLGDALIAGTALAHGATIVTRDEHFTRIQGLTVLKY